MYIDWESMMRYIYYGGCSSESQLIQQNYEAVELFIMFMMKRTTEREARSRAAHNANTQI